jgi:hypothetical protein
VNQNYKDSPKKRLVRVRQRKRRQRVRDLLERGVTSYTDIAARLGCTIPTATNDVKVIENRWLQYDIQMTTYRRSKRVKQLERIAREAYESFFRSKQNKEEISTIYTPRNCPECKGSGFAANEQDWCAVCDGRGEVMTEVVTKKELGQAGDSSFLRVVKECFMEAAKLEGLSPKRILQKVKDQTNIIQTGPSLDLSKVSPERLLEIKRIWFDTIRKINQQQPLVLEAKAIKDDG